MARASSVCASWGTQSVMRPYVKEFRILPRKTIRIAVGEPIDLSDLAARPADAPCGTALVALAHG